MMRRPKKIEETGNPGFDYAIRQLLEYHNEIDLGWCGALRMSERPKGIRTDRTWQAYMSAVVNVLVIGKRNGWLTIHQTGEGHPLYWRVNTKPHPLAKGSQN